MSQDFKTAAAEMIATAKCLEVLEPLEQKSREHIVLGLVVTIMQDCTTGGKQAVDELMRKMVARVR